MAKKFSKHMRNSGHLALIGFFSITDPTGTTDRKESLY